MIKNADLNVATLDICAFSCIQIKIYKEFTWGDFKLLSCNYNILLQLYLSLADVSFPYCLLKVQEWTFCWNCKEKRLWHFGTLAMWQYVAMWHCGKMWQHVAKQFVWHTHGPHPQLHLGGPMLVPLTENHTKYFLKKTWSYFTHSTACPLHMYVATFARSKKHCTRANTAIKVFEHLFINIQYSVFSGEFGSKSKLLRAE